MSSTAVFAVSLDTAGFLLVAVVASVIGSIIVWARHRKPTTFMSSIDDFQREMKALGRDDEAQSRRRRGTPRTVPTDEDR